VVSLSKSIDITKTLNKSSNFPNWRMLVQASKCLNLLHQLYFILKLVFNNNKNHLHKKCAEMRENPQKAQQHHSRRKLSPTYEPINKYKK